MVWKATVSVWERKPADRTMSRTSKLDARPATPAAMAQETRPYKLEAQHPERPCREVFGIPGWIRNSCVLEARRRIPAWLHGVDSRPAGDGGFPLRTDSAVAERRGGQRFGCALVLSGTDRGGGTRERAPSSLSPIDSSSIQPACAIPISHLADAVPGTAGAASTGGIGGDLAAPENRRPRPLEGRSPRHRERQYGGTARSCSGVEPVTRVSPEGGPDRPRRADLCRAPSSGRSHAGTVEL